MLRPSSAFVLLLLVCSACLDEGVDTKSGGGGPPALTCDDWKQAYCQSHAECSLTSSYSQCFDSVENVECRSDAPLSRCVSELGAGCDDVPTDCDAIEIAETDIAREKCDAFASSYCKSFVECGGSPDYQACVSEIIYQVNCDRAYAVGPTFDECLERLRGGACELALPDSCVGQIHSQ